MSQFLSSRRAVPLLVLLVLIPVFFIRACLVVPLFSSPAVSELPDYIGADRSRGRPAQALYQVEALAARAGWTPGLARIAGEMWRDMGDLTRAVPLLEAAQAGTPDDLDLVRELAGAYVDLNRWTPARDMLAHLLDLSPDDLWAHFQLGLILSAFDPRTAETHLRAAAASPVYADDANAVLSALTDNSGDNLTSIHVGLALSERKLWPYAELAFTQAANMGQTASVALAYDGLARDRQGKDGGPQLQQAITLDPQNPQVLYLMGLHLRATGDLDGSRSAIAQAVALDPNNPAYYAELSTAFRLQGNLDQAEHWLKVAVSISGNSPEFLRLLALFYSDESYNLTTDGLETLSKAISTFSEDPDLLAAFGYALHSAGQTTDGLAQINAALNIDPNNARALFEKARVLLDTGDQAGATELLRRLLEQDSPFTEEARTMLDRIGQ